MNFIMNAARRVDTKDTLKMSKLPYEYTNSTLSQQGFTVFADLQIHNQPTVEGETPTFSDLHTQGLRSSGVLPLKKVGKSSTVHQLETIHQNHATKMGHSKNKLQIARRIKQRIPIEKDFIACTDVPGVEEECSLPVFPGTLHIKRTLVSLIGSHCRPKHDSKLSPKPDTLDTSHHRGQDYLIYMPEPSKSPNTYSRPASASSNNSSCSRSKQRGGHNLHRRPKIYRQAGSHTKPKLVFLPRPSGDVETEIQNSKISSGIGMGLGTSQRKVSPRQKDSVYGPSPAKPLHSGKWRLQKKRKFTFVSGGSSNMTVDQAAHPSMWSPIIQSGQLSSFKKATGRTPSPHDRPSGTYAKLHQSSARESSVCSMSEQTFNLKVLPVLDLTLNPQTGTSVHGRVSDSVVEGEVPLDSNIDFKKMLQENRSFMQFVTLTAELGGGIPKACADSRLLSNT